MDRVRAAGSHHAFVHFEHNNTKKLCGDDIRKNFEIQIFDYNNDNKNYLLTMTLFHLFTHLCWVD